MVLSQVSPWTRLCELDVPSAVEELLRSPTEERLHLPAAVLQLERRLGEPVRVHNDDKIRRQKLQQQRSATSPRQEDPNAGREGETASSQAVGGASGSEPGLGVELSAALAKLSVAAVPLLSSRERPDIRKVRTTELPELEHVFAEGLYFTLTDVVLLPCIHLYLVNTSQLLYQSYSCISIACSSLTRSFKEPVSPVSSCFPEV